MAIDLKKLKFEHVEQLGLGLELPEEDVSMNGYVSPEEAQRRSEVAQAALKATGTDQAPDWFGQYQALLNSGWPWRVACYIAWAASPKLSRWPKTQEELAQKILGLTSDRQIGTWRRKNQNIDEMVAIMQAAPLLEYRADMIHALAISASNPDHRHNPDRKLMSEILGDYTPHVRIEDGRGDAEDLSSLSEEELDTLAKKLLEKKAKEETQTPTPGAAPSPAKPGEGEEKDGAA